MRADPPPRQIRRFGAGAWPVRPGSGFSGAGELEKLIQSAITSQPCVAPKLAIATYGQGTPHASPWSHLGLLCSDALHAHLGVTPCMETGLEMIIPQNRAGIRPGRTSVSDGGRCGGSRPEFRRSGRGRPRGKNAPGQPEGPRGCPSGPGAAGSRRRPATRADTRGNCCRYSSISNIHQETRPAFPGAGGSGSGRDA